MTVNGIIAEYNPFHNGHAYHISHSAEMTGADYTIVVMSGNFVQRGAPALIDKHLRTKMALSSGADLVIELPSVYALSCAEQFAFGGVSLLNSLGVVNHLCFGSESGDLEHLKTWAKALSSEDQAFHDTLKEALSSGQSYPKARLQALFKSQPRLQTDSSFLASPNNILALEYLQALERTNSSITPFTIARIGDSYHSETAHSKYPSATSIRKQLYASDDSIQNLKDLMPAIPYQILLEAMDTHSFLCENDFSTLLMYKLLLHKDTGYEMFSDITSDLSDRILNKLFDFTTFTGFCETLKTKNLTYSRISRGLTGILLDLNKAVPYTVPGYAHILGFKESAKPLLTQIKKNSSIPLVTKYADAKTYLSSKALTMLETDIRCAHIYETVLASKTGCSPRNETRRPIQKLF